MLPAIRPSVKKRGFAGEYEAASAQGVATAAGVAYFRGVCPGRRTVPGGDEARVVSNAPSTPASTRKASNGLVREVVCPNCWERFPPERIWYVATDSSLYGDLRLGGQELRRFLPTRFMPDGRALDPKGSPCHELACPRCHLKVPRVFIERPTFFVSVFGSPSSGKSYVLTTMMHSLRTMLPRDFSIDFSDADPVANVLLHAGEDRLFSGKPPCDKGFVWLEKTDPDDPKLFNNVQFGRSGKATRYYKPFFFQITPFGKHPLAGNAAAVARTLCIYDNAGEHFEPGADTHDNPATQHMARSSCMFFVYDPLQEPAFRGQLKALSADEQVQSGVMSRQEVILAEAAKRVRTHRRLAAGEGHDKPLIVLVNKYDAWQKLVGDQRLGNPWAPHGSKDFSVLRVDTIRRVSSSVRELLQKFTPAIVSTAETFVDPRLVYYLPISATGRSPVVVPTDVQGDAPQRQLGYPFGSLQPMWAAVPMLFALSQFGSAGAVGGGIIPFIDEKKLPAETPTP